jgi:hypothetical protein
MLQCVRAGERRILIVVDSWRREIERQAREGVPIYAPIRAAQEAWRRKTEEPHPIDVSELDL